MDRNYIYIIFIYRDIIGFILLYLENKKCIDKYQKSAIQKKEIDKFYSKKNIRWSNKKEVWLLN